MRTLFIVIIVGLSSYGCSTYSVHNQSTTPPTTESQQQTKSAKSVNCIGNTNPPDHLANLFTVAQDEQLLNSALGQPNQGKLCQGQVYQAKAGSQISIYRAWNSTNPNSQMGNWWAFQVPAGKVSQYRFQYEICYQWSPLDKMTTCTLKNDINVVIGTGQSAKCSEYLSYPAAEQKQLYIQDADSTAFDCNTYDGVFNWQNITQ